MANMIFDYFQGFEAEQFAFYRIPKKLFTDPYFKNLSSDAKILYGLMLERMSLSVKNQWIDEQNRVYILFRLEEVMELMGCGKDKGVKIMAELDAEKGVGLIERVRQGQGKPTLIYVKSFVVQTKEECEEAPEEVDNSQTSEKPKSRVRKNRSLEVGKAEVQTSEKPKSRSRKNRSPEVGKAEVNNRILLIYKILNSYTEYSNTEIVKKKETNVSKENEESFENCLSCVQDFIAQKQKEALEKNIPPDPLLPKTEQELRKWLHPLQQLLEEGWTLTQVKSAMKFALSDPFWKIHITTTKQFKKNIRILYEKASLKQQRERKTANFERREYDMDKLESQLLGL